CGTARPVQPNAAQCGATVAGTLDKFSFPMSLTGERRCPSKYCAYGDCFDTGFATSAEATACQGRSRSTKSGVERVVFNALANRCALPTNFRRRVRSPEFHPSAARIAWNVPLFDGVTPPRGEYSA